MHDLKNWQPCKRPGATTLKGQYAHVLPLDLVVHGEGLFRALCGDGNDDLWTYLPSGPLSDLQQLKDMLLTAHQLHGWETMVISCAQTAEILGMASYMRNREAHGSTEVGCITFSKKMQRSRIATDAMYLMARHVFEDLGYRRYEWKCNNKNEASKRAANRLGFQYEGLFRNDLVVKGANRDTAWFSMIDREWPALDTAFRRWLDTNNFDKDGLQKNKLANLRMV